MLCSSFWFCLCWMPTVNTSPTPQQAGKADGPWAWSWVSSGPASLTPAIFYTTLSCYGRPRKTWTGRSHRIQRKAGQEVGQDEGRGWERRNGSSQEAEGWSGNSREEGLERQWDTESLGRTQHSPLCVFTSYPFCDSGRLPTLIL